MHDDAVLVKSLPAQHREGRDARKPKKTQRYLGHVGLGTPLSPTATVSMTPCIHVGPIRWVELIAHSAETFYRKTIRIPSYDVSKTTFMKNYLYYPRTSSGLHALAQTLVYLKVAENISNPLKINFFLEINPAASASKYQRNAFRPR